MWKTIKIIRPTIARRFFSTTSGNKKVYDVAVIGGGPGGYSCAIKSSQLGLSTTCIEGRGTLGGTCLNVGCIPSKALLHNTHLYHAAKHDYNNRGIIINGDIKMDLNKLMTYKNNAVKGLTGGIEFLFKKYKVDYNKGWGKINKDKSISIYDNNGKEINSIQCKNIVIATGSESTPLGSIKTDENNIVTSTGALSFTQVPKQLIIVGAGVIGLELGSVWQRLGSEVIVIEFLNRILPGLDEAIAKKVQQILTKQGMKFHLNCAVQDVKTSSNNNLIINYKNNANANKIESINADKVLIAIGRKPVTKNIGLEELNIKMNGLKIEVNDKYQCLNHSNIYALGDVIKGPMLAHKAEDEGVVIAEIISGKSGHINYNAIPSVIYTYPEIASVGKTEEELKEQKIPYNKGEFPFMANSRARTNDETEGLVKILAHKETDRILGVHIIGPNAGEMIAEAAIGLEYGASSEDLGRTTHAHPTLSEAFKEACMSVYDKPIHF